MSKKKFSLFRSFRAKIMFFLILAVVFVAATSNLLIQRYALRSQFEQLRNRLMIIAQISASTIDAEKLIQIPLDKEGIVSEPYKAVADKLQKIKDAVPSLKYLYIMAKTQTPGILNFLVDVESQNNKNISEKSYPGDIYDATRFPDMIRGFQGPAADRKLTADKWGVFLSGYAPIRDNDGKVIAILGVDMTAQDVYGVQKEVVVRTIFVLFLSVVLAVIAGIVISGGVSRQVAELVKGAQRVAKGDLDYKEMIKGADEIARLASLFNQMSCDLKVRIEDLQRTTAEKERLLKELEIARSIQQSFLPDYVPQIDGLEIAAINLPARMVSGDFYDFIPLENDKWGFVISDVSGKGVPAALFMALSRTLMRASASVGLSPAEALNHTNALIMKDSKTNMFVTLFYAILNPKDMSFRYANAGHNPPLFLSGSENRIIILKAQSVPLGIMHDIKAQDEELKLKKGDILVLYTDGVTEAIDKNGEQFGTERLVSLAQKNHLLSAQELMCKIKDEVESHVGGEPQFDDITLMIIKAA